MKKTAIAAIVLAGVGVTASVTFADQQEMGNGQGGQEMSQGESQGVGQGQGRGPRGPRMGSGSEMGQGRGPRTGSGSMDQGKGGGFVDQYLRTDLTQAERQALGDILKKERDAMKTLADALKAGTVTQADFETQAKALRETHITEVLPYVATDKQDAFKAAMEARPLLPPKDGQGGQEGRGRMDNGTQSGSVNGMGGGIAHQTRQAKLLPDSIGTKIDAKLAAIATDAAKIDWLNAVIAKVEALEAKAKSKKAKSLFAELKDLLNEKLDALDGTSSTTDTTIDSILQ